MPKLSVKPENNKEEVKFNIYSLAFKDYHEKVGEINGKGSLELEEGSYKIEALDGSRRYQKVILLSGGMSTVLDFADKFEELKDPYAGLKGAVIGGGIVALIGAVFYLLGGLQLVV